LPTDRFSSCPESLPFSSASASSGRPDSASAVGSMMNPWLSSNFASSACAADESSRPTGPASPAWLSTLSQSFSAFHLRLAPPMNHFNRSILHFLSNRSCRPLGATHSECLGSARAEPCRTTLRRAPIRCALTSTPVRPPDNRAGKPTASPTSETCLTARFLGASIRCRSRTLRSFSSPRRTAGSLVGPCDPSSLPTARSGNRNEPCDPFFFTSSNDCLASRALRSFLVGSRWIRSSD